jgi:hypothetical protein
MFRTIFMLRFYAVRFQSTVRSGWLAGPPARTKALTYNRNINTMESGEPERSLWESHGAIIKIMEVQVT